MDSWDWAAGGAHTWVAKDLALGYPLETTIGMAYGWGQGTWAATRPPSSCADLGDRPTAGSTSVTLIRERLTG